MRSSCANNDPVKDRSLQRLFRLLPAALTAVLVLTAAALPAQQKGMIDIRGGSERDWQREFDDICSRVDGAMDMTREELEGLVFRCRALEPRIRQLPETPKKVYSRKLQMCRDLYQFVLEQRSGKAADNDPGGAQPPTMRTPAGGN